jgi:hypothetical protein
MTPPLPTTSGTRTLMCCHSSRLRSDTRVIERERHADAGFSVRVAVISLTLWPTNAILADPAAANDDSPRKQGT